jgi:predicted enzyme related to lactoylglutathione lyase
VKHTIVHFEIPAGDVARAKAFYGGLFGWEFPPAEGFPDCWMFLTGDPETDAGGGLMARQAPEQVGLVSYFGVESVDDALARVEELGGQVVMPKQAVPEMGWLAHFLDTEGNLFAVWQSDESAA